MLGLKIDSNKNLLFVTLSGITTDSDIVTGIGKAGELLPQLKDNFSIIMDLSKYKEASTEQGALFNKIIRSINDKKKINLVVRIVGQSKSAILNLCKMDRLFNLTNVKYVPSIEDAEKLLNGETHRHKDCL